MMKAKQFYIWFSVFGVLLGVGCADDMESGESEGVNFSLSRYTLNESFWVVATPSETPTVNEEFSLTLEFFDGENTMQAVDDVVLDVESVSITHIDHGHTSGTSPNVHGLTIHAINFDHDPEGRWQVRLDVTVGDVTDTVELNWDLSETMHDDEYSMHEHDEHSRDDADDHSMHGDDDHDMHHAE